MLPLPNPFEVIVSLDLRQVNLSALSPKVEERMRRLVAREVAKEIVNGASNVTAARIAEQEGEVARVVLWSDTATAERVLPIKGKR